MTAKTKMIGFWVDDDLSARVAEMAKANDRTVSDEMRHLVKEALAKFERAPRRRPSPDVD